MVSYRKARILQILILASTITLSGCFTDEYDLSDGINTDISVGGDSLSFPVGKTDSIFLGDLINGQDSSMLKEGSDGSYLISINDTIPSVRLDGVNPVSFSIAPISINPISTSFAEVKFPQFSFNPISFNSDLPTPNLTLGNKSVSAIHTDFNLPNQVTIPAFIDPGVPVPFNTGDISFNSGTKSITQSMDILGLPSVLKSIDEIQFSGSRVTLTFNKTNINAIGFDEQTDKITNFTISFPSNVTLTSPIGVGTAISLDKHSFTITNAVLSPVNGIYTASFVIQKLIPPAIDVNHELHYNNNVTYSIDYTFNGKINDVRQKPYTYPKNLDLGVNVKLDADPLIDNMIIKTNNFAVAVDGGSNTINQDVSNVPDAISKVNSLTFENGAELVLTISNPNVSPFVFSSGNCVINLPKSIVFKQFTGLNLTTNTLTIPYSNLFGTKTLGISGINLDKTVANNKINISDNLTYEVNGLQIGEATSDLFTLQGISGKKLNISANINNLNIQDASIETNSISLAIPSQNTNINISQLVSEDVKKIYSVSLRNPSQLAFTINISNLPSSIDSIFFDNYQISLPGSLKFAADPEITRNITTNKNILTINRGFKVSQGFSKTLTLESFDFGTTGKTLTNGIFTLNEAVTMQGNAYIKGTNLNSSQIGTVNVTPTISIGSMSLAKIEAKLAPTIEPISQSIKLDLPDLLKNEDNNLNIKNPVITLEIGNTTGIPISMNLNLVPKIKGVAVAGATINTTLNIAAAAVLGQTTWSKFRLSKVATILLNDDFQNIVLPELSELLKTLPDSISINVTPTITGERHLVDLYSPKNQLDVKYGVSVPLEFDENFKFQFSDTISGLKESLGDVLKLTNNIEIIAIVDSKIPLNLGFNLVPLDSDGKQISGITLNSDSIKPDDLTPINFGIRETVAGDLKKLDQIILNVSASKNRTLSLIPLRADQYFIVELRVRLPKGIAIKQ